jgi:hypothetical protein
MLALDLRTDINDKTGKAYSMLDLGKIYVQEAQNTQR